MNVFSQKQYTTVGILTILSFAMLPLYLFSSGGFQLVDVMIVLLSLAIFMAINTNEVQVGSYLISPFIPFISWSIIINSYYSMYSISEGGYFLSTVQLIFGFYILFLFSIVFNRVLSDPRGVKYLYWSLLAACITPWLLEANRGSIRNALSFNNPNQLAYYSILILSMLLLINSVDAEIRNKGKMRWILTIAILIFSNIFVIMSASRAGFVIVILLDIYFFYTLLRRHTKLFLFLVFMIVPLLMIAVQSKVILNKKSSNDMAEVNHIQTINKRFNKNDIIESLSKRAFGHIEDKNDFSIIFGGGANKGHLGVAKVESMLMLEAHNMIMEIFDSYGIIGVVLFLGGSVFFVVRLGSFPYKWFFFSTLLLYNISHNGIRFRCMWVAIALISVAALASSRRQSSKYYQLSELQTANRYCRP
ncbi:MAG: hypothetical protein NG784_05050 [Candidatus Jettenia sp.]|nr:hypothetical protein [Candidatus Jettenia sp.]